MERFVAVQVQYPRLSYVELIPLRGRNRAQRRLAPIEMDQQVAVVRLFLMRLPHRPGDPPTPERELHTFRISSLPSGSRTAPILSLDAEYDGGRTVHFRITGGGITPQAASARVPRRRRWWWVLLLLAMVLLGLGAFMVLRGGSGGPSAVSPGEPVEAETSSAGRREASLPIPEPVPAEPVPVEPVAEEASLAETEVSEAESVPPDSEGRVPSPERALPEPDLQVYFEPNQTELTAAARRELDELVAVLREYPHVPVSIVGHTALYGTEEGRIEISQGRAQGVAAYLRGQGWQPETEPIVRWVGSLTPVTRDRDGQQQNRRVEVSVGEDQSSR